MLDQEPRQVTREAVVNDSFLNVFAIRRGDWKLILSQHGGGARTQDIPLDAARPAGQLYHLGRDLPESNNEYMAHPEIVRDLTRLLTLYQDSDRSAPVKRQLPKREASQ